MNNDERTRILQLVAAGTISPSEAADLLSAIESPSAPPVRPLAPPPAPPIRRHLVIEIRSDGGESKVNLRIPLGLARAAGRFLPRQAQAYLNEHEINLEGLVEGITSTDDTGTLLEISDGGGDDQVRIAIE